MMLNQQIEDHSRGRGKPHQGGGCCDLRPAGTDAGQDTRLTLAGGFTTDATQHNRAGRGFLARLASFNCATGSSPRCAHGGDGFGRRTRRLGSPHAGRAATIQISRSPSGCARTFGQHVSRQGSDAAPVLQRSLHVVGFNTDEHRARHHARLQTKLAFGANRNG